MCRNIKILFNFDPLVTDDEINAASLQYVRKVTGFTKPSLANEEAFNKSVQEISGVTKVLLQTIVTAAPSRNREVEGEKARARAQKRFGK